MHLCSLAPFWLIDFDSFLKVTETHPMKSTSDPSDNWYKIGNTDEVTSPSLLVYPDRIEANIKKMIEIAGGVDRLQATCQTHKMPEII